LNIKPEGFALVTLSLKLVSLFLKVNDEMEKCAIDYLDRAFRLWLMFYLSGRRVWCLQLTC
jgi:hypothetical protein